MPKKSSVTPSETAAPETTEVSFEAAYRELEQIVARLEQGDLPLEQAIELHTRGQQLASLCATQLDHAELKVKKLESGD
ncbi:MAG: exodeoxyribonuclease VII small subunit [Chloroflexi bacterium]|nr:exodeoxyribonuclease VII small subunit [Chloroflexota bacterium]MCL5275182.1 exodeoxyribonuclease VII small subunit [Chloroflexota bacterium]